MKRHTSCLVVTVSLALTVRASGQGSHFTHERSITAARSGPQVLPVDVLLLRDASPFRVIQRGDRSVALDGLRDLRLFDSTGGPVPYLLVHRRDTQPAWVAGTLLPIAQTRRTSGFETDFGKPQHVDLMRVEGIPGPFLKRLVLEGSGDRVRWTMLAREGTLFDLPAERLRQIDVGFPAGEYRYLRVTWDDTNSGRVPMPRAVSARLRVRTELSPPSAIDVPVERSASEPGRSRYRLRLPAARLPIVAIELEVGPGHVHREATITESRLSGDEAAPLELGRAMLNRVETDGAQASNLIVSVTQPAESELQLVINDGSNLPLTVTRVSAILADLPFIYFEHSTGALVARYGNSTLDTPTYDIEAVRGSVDVTRLPRASWGDVHPVVESAAASSSGPGPAPGSIIDPSRFRYIRALSHDVPGLFALQLDSAVLAHSAGPANRFSDVRILDASNRQIPYLLERRDEPLVAVLRIEPTNESRAVEVKTAHGQQRSVYRIVLPYETLPASTLVIETSARVFQRPVQIGFERPADRHHRDAWFDVRSTSTWRHTDPLTPAAPLAVRIDNPDGRELLVVVEEGDNAALPLTAGRLLLPSYRLRFFHPPDAQLRLAYGGADLQVPRYDLSLLAQQVLGAAARDATADAEITQAGAAARDPLVSPWIFWTLLGVAVVVLVGLIAKLARQ